MARQCTDCGAVYDNDEATYCNACGSEALVSLAPPAPPSTPPGRLRDDAYSLVVGAVLWLPGLMYILGVSRPRTWEMLVFMWATLAIMGIVAGLVLRNVRTFVILAALGSIFVALYGIVKLS